MHDSRFGKVVVACATGGGFTALLIQLFAPYWGIWGKVLGIALGGLAAYLAYDWREIATAIRTASHEIIPTALIGMSSVVQNMLRFWTNPGLAMQQFLVSMVLLGATVGRYVLPPKNPLPVAGETFMLSIMSLMLAFALLWLDLIYLMVASGLFKENKKLWESAISESELFCAPFLRERVTWRNWGLLHVWAFESYLRAIPYGLYYVVVWAPTKLCQFVKHVFVLIHSDLRLLCGVDGAIGGWLGYFLTYQVSHGATLTPNEKVLVVLIGAAGAIVLGCLNYWYVSLPMLARQQQER